jgi:hypothetical protein
MPVNYFNYNQYTAYLALLKGPKSAVFSYDNDFAKGFPLKSPIWYFHMNETQNAYYFNGQVIYV